MPGLLAPSILCILVNLSMAAAIDTPGYVSSERVEEIARCSEREVDGKEKSALTMTCDGKDVSLSTIPRLVPSIMTWDNGTEYRV